MDALRATIQRNVTNLRSRMDAAATRAGRDPREVRLIPVTKSVDAAAIRILHDLGFTEVGENRVEAAAGKRQQLAALGLRWHMIGSLQRRKVKAALEAFDAIDSVDRIALAESLNERAGDLKRIVPVLLEANISGEHSKHGVSPAELENAAHAIRALPNLRLEGLLTMAPLEDDPECTRPVFRALREWGERLGVRELSMGMSNDFEVAIEEGATQVRIGTALFE